jgi:4-hydroxy-3-methylbut-2-enyl diphosphate reductase
MKLLLANPRGFCAGVKRAVDCLNLLVEKYPHQTIYCYHQIVHNTHVVKDFEDKGVKFVNSLDEVPLGSILVFSSHGVPPNLKLQTINHKLRTIDATCPFVAKTHLEVKKYAGEGAEVVYIGQPNHDEAVGTTGEAPENTTIVQSLEDIETLSFPSATRLALITQTTLSFDETKDLIKALKVKYPKIIIPPVSDICQATQHRQNGVKEMVKIGAELVIVLGSPNSSNSNKLKTVAEKAGAKAILADDIKEINPKILKQYKCLGLTAGASLPEYKISEAIEWFKSKGVKDIEEISVADESKLILPSINIT